MSTPKRKRTEDDGSTSPPRMKPKAYADGQENGINGEEATSVTVPRIVDHDPERKRERERQLTAKMAEQAEAQLQGGEAAATLEKPALDPKAEMEKLAKTRAGGTYIPPHRMRQMLADLDTGDKQSEVTQRTAWDALRKSIQGLVNKVNTQNIKYIIPELFGENLIRGRGLFARSVMRAQASSTAYTPVFAALVAIINTKLPQVGELVAIRVLSQFRKSFRRNDKVTCLASVSFIAHLINQQVLTELVAFQMLVLLLDRPTDDSVEVAVKFMREVGAFLAEAAPKTNNGVFDRFRAILHESEIDKRVQYMIEVLFQVRKDKYVDHPIITEGLDLVEDEDIIKHDLSLDDDLKTQDMLNVFKYDPEYEENEEKYAEMKREILGDEEESEEESGSEEDYSDEEGGDAGTVDIVDHTEGNLVNLRRKIYLTIMSALDFEEAVHKLLKIELQEGQEIELCNMVVECCSQERTYTKFYGLMGERLAKLNQIWTNSFLESFRQYYDTIHRYETNKLRNIARFFGHLIASDAIPWTVFSIVKMNEEETTSSSRIFIKIVMQEMAEGLGLKTLKERFKDESMKPSWEGMFPMDNPKNTRFSINFFTSVGLGILTEEMREFLKTAPALIMQQRRTLEAMQKANQSESSSSDSDSDSDSSSDVSSSTVSSSDSGTSRSYSSRGSRSGPRSRSRRRSPSSSPSLPPRRRSPQPRDSYNENSRKRRSQTPSRSPPSRRRGEHRYRSRSRSRTPPRRTRRYS